MDLSIPAEHTELADAARRILVSSVGRAAAWGSGSSKPEDRQALLDALGQLGVFDLDLHDHSEALAATLVAVEVGAAGVAVPLVPRLVARAAGLGDGVVHAVGRVSGEQLLNHLDLELPAWVMASDGSCGSVQALEAPAPDTRPLAAYASRATVAAVETPLDPWTWALHVTLTAASAYGAVRKARQLACTYAGERVQFGQPIGNFQRTRIRIAEIVVDESGLRELLLFTLWRLFDSRPDAVTDALLLRYQQLVVARQVLTSVHQIHAAMGFCYEYPLVQYTLGLQVDRQLPYSEPACLSHLVERFADIETHYERLAPAWPLIRADRVAMPTLPDPSVDTAADLPPR